MSKIEKIAKKVDLQEGKFANLKEPRKRKCVSALKHVCIQSSKDPNSMCWIWLLPLIYAAQTEPLENAEYPLTSQHMQSLPFAQLRQDKDKQREVLEMVKAHQTFIGNCAPLAEKVMEMLALKNFCREPVPQIQVPLQLLLSNVYQRITNRLAERREIDEKDVNPVLGDMARRTKIWLGARTLIPSLAAMNFAVPKTSISETMNCHRGVTCDLAENPHKPSQKNCSEQAH
ncbi:hypothetical protein UY3_15461 [Chelonia mydas]|uniref:Uncharacterized protein n=1 Tax=Chelonia mydas TaxID=8469 RepID=M7AWL9_CHEMY|nr:hypothetical protein UY3_15461 [Chelonia mydas]